MRWYIKDYDISSLNAKMVKLEKHLISKMRVDNIVTPEKGVYQIEDDTIYRLHHDSQFTNFFFNETKLICQHSEPIKEEIFSQMPLNFAYSKSHINKYAVSDSQSVFLFIELHDDGRVLDFYFSPVINGNDLTLLQLINLSKNEINRFLSLLN